MIVLNPTDSPFLQFDVVHCAHERALILLDTAQEAACFAKDGMEPGKAQDRAFADAMCILTVAHEYLTAIDKAMGQIQANIAKGAGS
ncbi:hypothetical protein [Sphingopyxis witflariensis]|uniref:DUF3077 domain-containing protein n=1 Tax=Sphingopyxis witflariensis TaxID=173675 RepID=A0A2D0ANB2_9SPHN|nr:hypothetical protein [Sphingopyxis witflariensis]OWQ95105.1 hypothetical protein CDQ91_14380 [Sphingopyxis witflariensis]